MSDSLVERVRALHAGTEGRTIIGVAGCPGSGKTTLVQSLLQELERVTPGRTAWVPMDGFHLADSSLRALRRLDTKGAIDTFDARGYLATLRRIRAETTTTVYAPEFDRTIEQPIAAGMAVPPGAEIIVTEGNYLLDTESPWPSIRSELDEVWFCEAPEQLRIERLVARHVAFGKTPLEAAAWVESVDEPNARRIQASRASADHVISTETPINLYETVLNP